MDEVVKQKPRIEALEARFAPAPLPGQAEVGLPPPAAAEAMVNPLMTRMGGKAEVPLGLPPSGARGRAAAFAPLLPEAFEARFALPQDRPDMAVPHDPPPDEPT